MRTGPGQHHNPPPPAHHNPPPPAQTVHGGGTGWVINMARDILRGLGAPVTTANLNALMAWRTAEGGSAHYNIFNTTQGAAGASNYNSVGVKNYTSYQQGLTATLQTLRNGYYGGILAALHQGTNPYAVAAAVEKSPWGTSGSLMASVLHGWGLPYGPGGSLHVVGSPSGGGNVYGGGGGTGHGGGGGTLSAAAPGGQRQLAALIAALASRPLQAIPQQNLNLPTTAQVLSGLMPGAQSSGLAGTNPNTEIFNAIPKMLTPTGQTTSQLGTSLDAIRRNLLKGTP